MSNLTAILNLQHLRISNLLEAVQWIGGENPEALRKLKAARVHLLAHLKLEDTYLYPILFEAAKKNVELKQTLAMLANDMAGVSKEVLNFFEQCDKGGPQVHTKLDIGKILLLLQTRIRREEDTLYHEFDRLRAAARTTVTEQTTDSRASTKGFFTFNSSRSSHLTPHL